MKYDIHEGNMERLRKQLNRIKNKCSKLNVEFKFEELGETFKTVTDDINGKHTARFITVETEGIVQYENWEFVATIEHNTPMNIIRSFRPDIEIPKRYFTAKTCCDHCKTLRARKDTYIIRNTETGEFKQVGKSCLKEFTRGLSAEDVAKYMSWFDEIIVGCIPSEGYTSYESTKDVVQFAVEAVNMYGYRKSDYDGDSTKVIVLQQMYHFGVWKERIDEGFNEDREGNKELAEKALAWIAAQEDDFGYISNLRSACSREYCERRDFGLIVSLIPTYLREMGKIERQKKIAANEAKSEYVGEIGKRIMISGNINLLTSWDTIYGYTYLYKITDKEGNIFTWKTGKWLSDSDVFVDRAITLKGTVKNHNEFHGVKQTELTRCSEV